MSAILTSQNSPAQSQEFKNQDSQRRISPSTPSSKFLCLPLSRTSGSAVKTVAIGAAASLFASAAFVGFSVGSVAVAVPLALAALTLLVAAVVYGFSSYCFKQLALPPAVAELKDGTNELSSTEDETVSAHSTDEVELESGDSVDYQTSEQDSAGPSSDVNSSTNQQVNENSNESLNIPVVDLSKLPFDKALEEVKKVIGKENPEIGEKAKAFAGVMANIMGPRQYKQLRTELLVGALSPDSKKRDPKEKLLSQKQMVDILANMKNFSPDQSLRASTYWRPLCESGAGGWLLVLLSQGDKSIDIFLGAEPGDILRAMFHACLYCTNKIKSSEREGYFKPLRSFLSKLMSDEKTRKAVFLEFYRLYTHELDNLSSPTDKSEWRAFAERLDPAGPLTKVLKRKKEGLLTEEEACRTYEALL